MKLLRSKIFWVNLITFVLALLPIVSETLPNYVSTVALVGPVMTVLLRQLQGKEIKLGSKTIKL